MLSFQEYLKESVEEFTLWVSKEDSKDAIKVMKKLGIDFSVSASKVSKMVVWDISSDALAVEHLQNELADKDINSWLDGVKN